MHLFTYTVCRLVPGERTVCKQHVPSSRSGYPSLNRSLTTSCQRQRHQPVATVMSPKLAEAPPIPGVTNALFVCLQHLEPGQAAVPLRPGGSPSGARWEETVPLGKPQVLHLPEKVVHRWATAWGQQGTLTLCFRTSFPEGGHRCRLASLRPAGTLS